VAYPPLGAQRVRERLNRVGLQDLDQVDGTESSSEVPVASVRSLWQRVVPCLLAVALMLVLWLAPVPWDLSYFDEQGNVIAGGGDATASRVGLVLALLTVLWVLLAFAAPRLPVIAMSICASVGWVVLWSWRAAISRVEGANLWPL